MTHARLVGCGRVLGVSLVVAAVAWLAGAGEARASVVDPGQTVALGGVTAVQAPWHGTQWWTETEVRSFVIFDADDNVLYSGIFGSLGVLTPPLAHPVVWYEVRSRTDEAPSPVASITVEGVGDQALRMEYRADVNTGAAPSRVVRSADGNTLRVEYDGGIMREASRPVYAFSTGSGLERGRVTLTLVSGETVVFEDVLVPGEAGSCAADTNGDNIVNFADLNAVLSNFGDACR